MHEMFVEIIICTIHNFSMVNYFLHFDSVYQHLYFIICFYLNLFYLYQLDVEIFVFGLLL